jgi:hypothetical protein
MGMQRWLGLATVAGALFVCSSAASAADTRYADDTGTAAAPCTVPGAPCSLATAVTAVVAGDTVSVAPGTYPNPGGLALGATQTNVEIVGEPGGPKPVLQFAGASGLTLGGQGDKLRNLAVQAPNGATAITVGAAGAVTLNDVDVTASGICLNLMGPGSTIESSKFTSTGGAFSTTCVNGFPADNTTIRDVEVTSTASTPSATPGALVALIGTGITVDRLVVTNPVGAAAQIGSLPGAIGAQPTVMRRSRLSGAPAVGPFGSGAVLGVIGGATVSDTVVRSSGSSASAIQAGGGKLRNVTAIATGAGSRGLWLPAVPAPFGGPVSVRNSVLRGEGSDIQLDPGMPEVPGNPICTFFPFYSCTPGPSIPATTQADLTITHSNFRNATGTLNQASGDNQTADPLFADAAGGDLRPRAGSPLIDAGTDDPDNGQKDLDGRERKIGSAIDIGAYEFEAPGPGTPGDAGTPTIQPPPEAADGIAPQLADVGITNKKFAVGPEATALASARAKRGTVFVYSLSEPSTVAIVIQRAGPGRRKGRSCVKPTRRNREASKCTRYTSAGAFTRSGLSGVNAVPFSGRIGRKALKVGKYRAVFAATDAAGNRSTHNPSVGFRIVRR